MKYLAFLCLFFSNQIFAADTIKLNVATQTYQCQIANQNLNCQPVNQVQSKIIDMPRSNGRINVADAPRNLDLEIDTALNNNNMIYTLTLCSAKTCTINDVYSNATGGINQVMLGQYDITETSFYVLGVSVTNGTGVLDFSNSIEKLQQNFR